MSERRREATLGSVFDRTMHEQARVIVGWLAGLTAFCVMMLSIYPTVRANEGFAKLINAYPEILRKLFQLSDYTTGAGYLRTEVFSFMAPLLIAIFAILWGSDQLAGEEERGTVDVFLANPVSRRRVVIEKWLALVTGTAMLAALLVVALGALGPAFRLHVGWAPLASAVLGSYLFAVAVGTLALCVGAATGSRGMARGVATALAVAMYLVSSLSQIVSWLEPARPASLWYHALGVGLLSSGFHYWHLGLVVVVTVALLGATVVLFDRRDLST